MSRSRNFSYLILIAVTAVLAFAFDQWTKHIVLANFMPGESRIVVDHLLKWTYEQNFHGAFGMFGSNPVLLIGMGVIVLAFFWFSYREAAQTSRLVCVAFGLIVGGAIGNIVDRLHFGYVVDFIDFYRIWPNIFNIGDSCITAGVILLLLKTLASRRRA